ncbi:MAG: CRISPR-associated endonuclease Cas2 [Rhodospirillales bacterium]|nr:MAG: CRISPR-associated endonuclease Cas2 [Rhodospirillales bacterium]
MAKQKRWVRVFAYDVVSNRMRSKVADILEEVAVRVQLSVFEGRLTDRELDAVMARLQPLLTREDKLRVYTLPDGLLAACRRIGGAPLPEQQGFWLL